MLYRFIIFFLSMFIATDSFAGIYDLMSVKSYEWLVGKCEPMTPKTLEAFFQVSQKCEKCSSAGMSDMLLKLKGPLNEVAEDSFFLAAAHELHEKNICDIAKIKAYKDTEFAAIISEFKEKVPALKEIKKRAQNLNVTLQLLKGRVPTNLNNLPLSAKDQSIKKQYDDGQEELRKLAAAHDAILVSLPLGNNKIVRELAATLSEKDLADFDALKKNLSKAYGDLEKQLISDSDVSLAKVARWGLNRQTKEAIVQDPHFFQDIMAKYSLPPEEAKSLRCYLDSKYGTGARIMDATLLTGSLVTMGGAAKATALAGRAVVGATAVGRAGNIITSGSARILRASAIGLASITAFREIDKDCFSTKTPDSIQATMGAEMCADPKEEARSIAEGSCVLTLTLSALGLTTAKQLTDLSMPAVQRLTQHLASSGRYLQINSEYALQLLKRSVQGDSAPLSVLQKTELLSEKYLKSSGVKVKPLDRKSYLEPTEGGGKGSSVSRLEVVELPEPLASTSGYSQALFHPEMAAYKKKLEDMGYKLVIDPTLSITDVAGYHQRETMTVALGVESSWTTFRHEFRHAEFADAIGNYRKFIDHYNLKATNKSLLEIWGGPGGPVEKLGKESVLKIEKMVKQGQNELAINETLAVDAELKSLGWKRFIPVVHATHVDYAYSYQVKSAGKAGKDATISRRKMWAQEVGAGIAVVGGGIKSLNELFSESVQVLYRADGEMIAQSKDGTWVQIIPEKDKSK